MVPRNRVVGIEFSMRYRRKKNEKTNRLSTISTLETVELKLSFSFFFVMKTREFVTLDVGQKTTAIRCIKSSTVRPIQTFDATPNSPRRYSSIAGDQS